MVRWWRVGREWEEVGVEEFWVFEESVMLK